MIDQAHNVEGKLAPMILSVLNCQEAYAKAQLVPRNRLKELQEEGRVLEAHHLLTEVSRTDVRPLLAQVRTEMDVPVDPIGAYFASGYEAQISEERGLSTISGGYQ